MTMLLFSCRRWSLALACCRMRPLALTCSLLLLPPCGSHVLVLPVALPVLPCLPPPWHLEGLRLLHLHLLPPLAVPLLDLSLALRLHLCPPGLGHGVGLGVVRAVVLGGLPLEQHLVPLLDVVWPHVLAFVLLLLHHLLGPVVLLPRLLDVLPPLGHAGPHVWYLGDELPAKQQLGRRLAGAGVRAGPHHHEVVVHLEVGVLVVDLGGAEDPADVLHEGLHPARGLRVLGAVVGHVLHTDGAEVLLQQVGVVSVEGRSIIRVQDGWIAMPGEDLGEAMDVVFCAGAVHHGHLRVPGEVVYDDQQVLVVPGGPPVVAAEPLPGLLWSLVRLEGVPVVVLGGGLAGQALCCPPLHLPVHAWEPEPLPQQPLGSLHAHVPRVPQLHHPVP